MGFHIAVKTFWAPQWIWATFEQVDNVPGNTAPSEPVPHNYSFFNRSAAAPTLAQCLEQRPGITPMGLGMNPDLAFCLNQQNIDNSRPDPGNTGDMIPLFRSGFVPAQVSRLDPIGNDTTEKSVKDLNALFRGLLARAGSPLQYYIMVNTQWPLNGRRSEDTKVPFGISNKLCLGPKDNPADCVRFLPVG